MDVDRTVLLQMLHKRDDLSELCPLEDAGLSKHHRRGPKGAITDRWRIRFTQGRGGGERGASLIAASFGWTEKRTGRRRKTAHVENLSGLRLVVARPIRLRFVWRADAERIGVRRFGSPAACRLEYDESLLSRAGAGPTARGRRLSVVGLRHRWWCHHRGEGQASC